MGSYRGILFAAIMCYLFGVVLIVLGIFDIWGKNKLAIFGGTLLIIEIGIVHYIIWKDERESKNERDEL